MATKKTMTIAVVGTSIAIQYTYNGVAKQYEYYPICSVKGIVSTPEIDLALRSVTTNQRKTDYHHDSVLEIGLYLEGPKNLLRFDIQDVTNQGTWTPDAAGLAIAVADINTWISECGCCADSEAFLEEIRDLLIEIRDNTDDIETIAANSLTTLQNIDLNTDTLETLLDDVEANQADILAELQTQTGILNGHTTILSNILTGVTNNTTELQDIQVQLATQITELQAINVNTAPLEASLTAIEAAIAAASALSDADLNAIQTQLNTVITELTTMSATLSSINGQFTGTVAITTTDISGNAAYGVAASTYNSLELTVESGTVSRGARVYQPGVYPITAPLNKTLPALTFDATGAVAYIDLMS